MEILKSTGYILIALGVFLLAVTIFISVKRNLKKEIRDYKNLTDKYKNKPYIPHKPIERMYEKKPIGSNINHNAETEIDLNDEEIDRIVANKPLQDDFLEDTGVLDEEATDVLNEATDVLQDDVFTEESTDVLEEITDVLDMSTDVLEEENTSVL